MPHDRDLKLWPKGKAKQSPNKSVHADKKRRVGPITAKQSIDEAKQLIAANREKAPFSDDDASDSDAQFDEAERQYEDDDGCDGSDVDSAPRKGVKRAPRKPKDPVASSKTALEKSAAEYVVAVSAIRETLSSTQKMLSTLCLPQGINMDQTQEGPAVVFSDEADIDEFWSMLGQAFTVLESSKKELAAKLKKAKTASGHVRKRTIAYMSARRDAAGGERVDQGDEETDGDDA